MDKVSPTSDARAYVYEEVNSITITTIQIGAPITAPVTAAIPLITKAGSNFSRTPITTNSSAITAPALAPTSIAGENTPPKKPNPKEIDVAMIFPSKIIIAKYNTNSPETASRTVPVPKPITSGTKWPIALRTTIAIAYLRNTFGKILTESLLKKIKVFIKIIATTPKSGPAINDT